MLIVRGKTLIGKFWSRVNILVSDSGFIVKIFKSDMANRYYYSKVDAIYNAEDRIILPGLIDGHVHFREPGQTYKENFESGSKCALASGVVVVGDMPNNVPETKDMDTYRNKMKSIEGKSYIDFFLYVALNRPEELKKLLSSNPAPRAVKVFLSNKRHLDMILREKDFPDDYVYVFHAEHSDFFQSGEAKNVHELNFMRPEKAEIEAVKVAIHFAERGYRTHITHVSTGDAANLIINAKMRGLKITFDVTPHHLIFYREAIDSYSPLLKVLPPIRSKNQRDKLISILRRGDVDAIFTDHAPHAVGEKEDFLHAEYGIQSLQYLLPLIFSLVVKTHMDFRKIIRLLSKNPAKIFSISKRGWIKVGNCADLVIFDPKRRWIIDPDFCLSKSRASPYDGMFVRGFVDAVFLRGNLVYENGYFIKKIGKHI